MMLGKKQIRAVFNFFFKFKFKWVVKQWTQFTSSATHLAHEPRINIQCSGGSGSFAKETRALKTRITVAGDQKLTTNN